MTAVPAQVRAEGLAERLGDIVLQCSGSTPGAVLAGNLTVILPVNVTNRVDASNQTHDSLLSVDYGSGFVPSGMAAQVSSQFLSFNGLSVTVPPSGALNFKISGIRGAVYQAGAVAPQAFRASLSFSSPASIALDQSQVVVAYPQTSLLATFYSTGITCAGSPFPDTPTLPSLFAAGTAFASTRVTEAQGAAFQPQQAGDDNGTRFLVKYSGFPANTHLYIPNAVAGSNALVPTAGGDLGAPQQVGQYVPGSRTLLLVRVLGADPSGAGGFQTQIPVGPGPLVLGAVAEVPLTGGSGYAVYEVVDANPLALESAQFPTFIGLTSVTTPAVAQESISLAPVSTVFAASASAPIPRFAAVVPPSDCTLLGDCGAAYFPKLSVVAPPIELTAIAGGAMTSQPGYIPIQNAGGGILNWAATVAYMQGSGWLMLDRSSGQNNASIRVWALPQNLAAGKYQATITIDAGALAGRVTIPLTLTVSPAPVLPPPAPTVVVTKVVNAATFEVTPLVAGSLGTVMGSHLNGKSVTATFDGSSAVLLYVSDTQINLQVPPDAGSKTSASLVVTVDSVSSAPFTVALAPASPAIFTGGVLNQDNTVNSPTAAANAGSILQIFATGIPAQSTVSAQIADRKDLVPLYAGLAPTLTGVQQINVAVPADLAAAATQLVICATTRGQQYCSPGYPLAVQ